MSFRLVPKSVTLNDLERRKGIISANSGSFRVHSVKVHVRYLISWWVLVNVDWMPFQAVPVTDIGNSKSKLEMIPWVLWHCWSGDRKGIWAVKHAWHFRVPTGYAKSNSLTFCLTFPDNFKVFPGILRSFLQQYLKMLITWNQSIHPVYPGN